MDKNRLFWILNEIEKFYTRGIKHNDFSHPIGEGYTKVLDLLDLTDTDIHHVLQFLFIFNNSQAKFDQPWFDYPDTCELEVKKLEVSLERLRTIKTAKQNLFLQLRDEKRMKLTSMSYVFGLVFFIFIVIFILVFFLK